MKSTMYRCQLPDGSSRMKRSMDPLVAAVAVKIDGKWDVWHWNMAWHKAEQRAENLRKYAHLGEVEVLKVEQVERRTL